MRGSVGVSDRVRLTQFKVLPFIPRSHLSYFWGSYEMMTEHGHFIFFLLASLLDVIELRQNHIGPQTLF